MDWNGEYLGKKKNKKELALEWNCTIAMDRFSLFAIMDECCPLFGFEKIGTVTITIGKTRNTCYQLEKGNKLSPKELEEDLRRQIQDYFVFRWIFCLPVKFVYERGEGFVEDFTPPKVENFGIVPPDWFVDTVLDSKKRLLQGRHSEVVAREIKEVITRVNREAVVYYTEIKSRLATR
jgi:hypothetical protein